MPAKVDAKKSKSKPATAQVVGGRLKRRSKRSRGFYKGMGRYILRIFKNINGKKRVSCNLVKVLTSFIFDQCRKLLHECQVLERKVGTRTIRGRTVKSAIQLLYAKELAKYMLAESDRAVEEFKSHTVRKQ